LVISFYIGTFNRGYVGEGGSLHGDMMVLLDEGGGARERDFCSVLRGLVGTRKANIESNEVGILGFFILSICKEPFYFKVLYVLKKLEKGNIIIIFLCYSIYN
jgi:hypothetical protein